MTAPSTTTNTPSTQVSLGQSEWNAAQAFAAPVVAAAKTERDRTFDLMVSGAPMYGAPAA